VEGHIGDFKVGIKSASGSETLEVGTIILAIGAEEYIPHKFYGYDDNEKVVTLADFERMSKKGELKDVKDVAFIQCVGARDQDKTYCSRICCNVAIKAAIHLADKVAAGGGGGEAEAPKAEEPEKTGGRKRRSRRRRDGAGAGSAPSSGGGRANITIFNRTINAYGVHHEINFNTAREKRIKFQKYDLDNLPKISAAGDKVKVEYFAETLGGWRDMTVDMVVLSTPLVNHPEAEGISKLLKIPRGAEGFFLEAHVKLRPVEFATEGVYLAGTCRAPADITEAVIQANAAASRASIPMAIGFVQGEALMSHVNQDICVGCGTCTTVCAFNAIQLNENNKAETITAACKGCGACASVCPQKAITMTHYSDDQLLSEVLACFEEVKE
jgi:heterodisulfide reductase subunit A